MPDNCQIPVAYLVIVNRFYPQIEKSVTLSTQVYAERESAYACKTQLEQIWDGEYYSVKVTRRYVKYGVHTPIPERAIATAKHSTSNHG